MAGRRVLITGVAGHLGCAIAARLEREPSVELIVGVDTRPPASARMLERTEYVEADIRGPALARLFPALGVDTVVHNKIVRRPPPGTSLQATHDLNVMGALQLLAACERAPTVRAIVVRGSAAIYGAEPHAPQFFTEDMVGLFPPRTPFGRDAVEIERLFEAFARRHEDVACTLLRYQPSIGPSLDTQLTRLLSLPVVPTYVGFDPRLQLLHEHDAVEALVAAVERPVRGAVNVAGDGTVGLARLARMTGRPTLPLPSPLFGSALAAARHARLHEPSPDFRRLLRYGRGVDTRRLVEEVGYRPRYSTVAAVRDYVSARRERRPAGPLREAVAR